MNEAANTLLSLSGEAERSTTETTNLETQEPEQTPRPPVAFEVNVIIDPGSNQVEIKPNQIIGSAIKEEGTRDLVPNPDSTASKPKTKGKTVTKQFSMKSYKLKQKT